MLHNEKPDFVKKLVAIEGNSAEKNLGIDEKTWMMISDEVLWQSIIYQTLYL